MNTENVSPVYNSFDEPSCKENTNHIRALMLVQKDIIQLVLNDREKFIVDYCICKGYRQNIVASMLGIGPSSVNKALKAAIRKMQKYIVICDKVLSYYENEEDKA